jgi:hypothetical protein
MNTMAEAEIAHTTPPCTLLLGAVLLFLAVLSASTPTEQEADGRGFPLSRQVHQPGGGVVPPIPCSA